MGRWSKRLKKYERHVLLGLVILLLVSFSVSGAIQCGPQNTAEQVDYGGEFLVAPNQTQTVDHGEFTSMWNRYAPFLGSVQAPSLTMEVPFFLRGDWLYGSPGTWAHLLTSKAARASGYRCTKAQLTAAVQSALARVVYPLDVTDATYDEFLNTRYPAGATEFQATVEEVVLKDAFLRPVIDTNRYAVSYREAYETWKRFLRRMNVGFVALRAEDFNGAALRRERTRSRLGRQGELLSRVSVTARQLKGLDEKIEAWKGEHEGALPESLSALLSDGPASPPKDAWEQEILYAPSENGFELRSPGPDGAPDSSDDVTLDTVRQIRTRATLRELANRILAHHDRESAWPESLAALRTADEGDEAVEEEKDAWARALVYQPADEEAGVPSLSSTGPDGVPGNADDVLATLRVEEGNQPFAVIPLGSGLVAYLNAKDDADLDAWERPFRIDLADPAAWEWTVASAGPDGKFGTDEDIRTGNESELRRLYAQARSEFIEPEKRRYAAIYLHLPLVPDRALRALITANPDLAPDERRAFNRWRKLSGDTAYLAEDPADPVTGEGAELAARLAPDHTPTLVPDASIFPAPPEVLATELGEDFATYVDRGWRPILLREIVMDNLMKQLHRRLLAASDAIRKWKMRGDALAKWEEDHAKFVATGGEDPGERPEAPGERPPELTLETAFAEALGDAAPTAEEPRWVGIYRSDKPLRREEWETLDDIGDINLTMNTQQVRDPGEFARMVLVLNIIHTLAIVQNVEFLSEREKEYEEVYGVVFDRLIERTRLELARRKLDELRAVVTKTSKSPEPAQEGAEEGAEAPAESWDRALAEWTPTLVNPDGSTIPHFLGDTGWFVGARPPLSAAPEAEELTDEEMGSRMRIDYVRQAGPSMLEAAVGREGELKPGTVASTVLTDQEIGTDSTYLVRLIDAKFPPPEAFSLRDYRNYLISEIFGGPQGGPGMGSAGGQEQRPGALRETIRNFFSDWFWLRNAFDLRTSEKVEEELAEHQRQRGRQRQRQPARP